MQTILLWTNRRGSEGLGSGCYQKQRLGRLLISKIGNVRLILPQRLDESLGWWHAGLRRS